MTAVLTTQERHSRFTDPLKSPTAQRYFLDGQSISIKSPLDFSDHSSLDTPSSTTLSPLPQATELPSNVNALSLDQHGEEILLPSYDSNDTKSEERKESEDTFSETSADLSTDLQYEIPRTPAADDSSIEEEPSRHVDYLSHEWKEEDIWASWRYVVARRNIYSNGARLENASWRTWAKLKRNLGTISPEDLNWLKDCDVTWLYGPLKTSRNRSNASPPPSRLGTPTYMDRKSILKKKTASETILQRSLSQHTLLRHAGAILKAQEAGRNRPSFSEYGQLQVSSPTTLSIGGTSTALPSGVNSPKRHIHFNNEVSQCIAVDAKDGEHWTQPDESLSSDDDIVTMSEIPPEALNGSRGSPRGSFNENKTIAPLPSTTLKYRGETTEPPMSSFMNRWSGGFWGSTVSQPSQPTQSKPEPSANFLLDGDDEDDYLDFSWHAKQSQSRPWFINPVDEEELGQDPPLELSSDLFADERESNAGMFDKVVDTVNTARDIAHVIWNVGWRR